MLTDRKKLYALLSPSLLSIAASVMLSIAIVAIVLISSAAGKGTIYNYLFGPGSSADLIASSRSTLSALDNTILGNAILNKVLYFAFWMVVGLVVYIVLYTILRGTGDAAEGLIESNYANVKKDKILQAFAIKSSVRLAAIFAWVTFTIIFFKVLLPFSCLAAKNASSDFLSLNGLAYGLLSFLTLMLSFHLEVVLTRFIFLRVRLLSQQEVEA